MTTLLVAGPRDWGVRDWEQEFALWQAMKRFAESFGLHEVIHGAAPGADQIARNFAKARPEIVETPFPADWRRFGNAAGPRRNKAMARYLVGQVSDHGSGVAYAMVCRYGDEFSKGTANLYRHLCMEAEVVPILVTHVLPDGNIREEALPRT